MVKYRYGVLFGRSPASLRLIVLEGFVKGLRLFGSKVIEGLFLGPGLASAGYRGKGSIRPIWPELKAKRYLFDEVIGMGGIFRPGIQKGNRVFAFRSPSLLSSNRP